MRRVRFDLSGFGDRSEHAGGRRHAMNDAVHISSLLVSAKPSHLVQVEQDLARVDIVEIAHVADNGKIIVTLETADESAIVQALTDIQLIDGVVSAALVFHQVDDAENPTTNETIE